VFLLLSVDVYLSVCVSLSVCVCLCMLHDDVSTVIALIENCSWERFLPLDW